MFRFKDPEKQVDNTENTFNLKHLLQKNDLSNSPLKGDTKKSEEMPNAVWEFKGLNN